MIHMLAMCFSFRQFIYMIGFSPIFCACNHYLNAAKFTENQLSFKIFDKSVKLQLIHHMFGTVLGPKLRIFPTSATRGYMHSKASKLI